MILLTVVTSRGEYDGCLSLFQLAFDFIFCTLNRYHWCNNGNVF